MDPKDEIKAKLDIVAVIGEYLELKPAGMHGFRALCPFHAESVPRTSAHQRNSSTHHAVCATHNFLLIASQSIGEEE